MNLSPYRNGDGLPRRRCLPRSFHSSLFPPRHQSPDSAVQVLSPTGKTPESRSAEPEWRILGITHVWRRICWERTTPLAPSTSKAVSTATPWQRERGVGGRGVGLPLVVTVHTGGFWCRVAGGTEHTGHGGRLKGTRIVWCEAPAFEASEQRSPAGKAGNHSVKSDF